MGGSRLEDALLDRLQEFPSGAGTRFLFEARRKRIMLDDEHAFVDIVFASPCAQVPRPDRS